MMLEHLKGGAAPVLRLGTFTAATPLHLACLSGHARTAELLLKAEPLVASQADNEGQLPLHVAADVRASLIVQSVLTAPALQGEVARMLVRKDKYGRTPLHYAAMRCDLHSVQASVARRILVELFPGGLGSRRRLWGVVQGYPAAASTAPRCSGPQAADRVAQTSRSPL